MPDVVYIALGSNLGDRDGFLSRGRAAIAAIPGTRVLAESEIEETEPFGPPQPRYLNQMIAIETALPPHGLLEALQRIEDAEGRTRDVHWGPRTLDLDIVVIEDRVLHEGTLVVPHPGLPDREFWQRQLVALRDRVRAKVARAS